MDNKTLLKHIEDEHGVRPVSVIENAGNELYVEVEIGDFKTLCLALHKKLNSPVMLMFACDERAENGTFRVLCAFLEPETGEWVFAVLRLPAWAAAYPTLSRDIYSSHLFEREIKEMFGIEPDGNPDARRLQLHDESWPGGNYPLRKDFAFDAGGTTGEYRFREIEGDGVFEVPVGPVHAGIIGPGHFRFSVAGEPIIRLEIRLGFTHRGVEKLFEGRTVAETVSLAERVSGDAVCAHSLAFCRAFERIHGVAVPEKAEYLRALFLELERMYNHVAGIGGIALDAGFSFPSSCASLLKEAILALNERLTGSRYLKDVIVPGGVAKDISETARRLLAEALDGIMKDFGELKRMLLDSVSFMDRVDTTGILKTEIARDLGIVGLPARASGILLDLRKTFPGVYAKAGFSAVRHREGDVLARLKVRIEEFEESARLVNSFLALLGPGETVTALPAPRDGFALGWAEGWRGPVVYWVRTGASGTIERCKVVDPSFHNWPGLAYAAPGNIIPDFPLCNKSFDLSYSGNDL